MSQEPITITRAEVAQALVEPRTVRLLEPFMRCERTLGEAARELGIKLPALSYHVGKFLAYGLLEVSRTEARSRRKRYRSTAQAFLVPYALTPSESLARLLNHLVAKTEMRFHREAARTLQNEEAQWRLCLSWGEDEQGGGLKYTLLPQRSGYTPLTPSQMLEPTAAAIFLNEGDLELDFESAKALQRELSDLIERYRKSAQPGQQKYAYRLGLTPLHDDTLGP